MKDAQRASTQPVRKREIFGWAFFDFANSSYTTVVITAVYSGFFTRWIVPENSSLRDSWWSIAMIASTILAIAASPLVGAISDLSGRKKAWLVSSTVGCALLTMTLAFAGPGDVFLAVLLLALSNACFMLSESFCGSFLPDVANESNMGKISGLGWGLGYFGGLASLAMVLQLTTTQAPEGAVSAVAPEMALAVVSENQLAMVFTGLFFLVASLPSFFFLKNRAKPAPGFEKASLGTLALAGLRRLAGTVREAREHKVLFQFLIAFMFYMAGVDAIIKFVGIYATSELGFVTSDLVKMFLVLQLSAAAGAVGFGLLESKLGAKATVMLTLFWWMGGILAIFFLDALAEATGLDRKNMFLVLALIAGSGLGSVQSSSRTVVGLLAPKARAAEMFGFWGLFGRAAALLGTSFGFASDALDSRRFALLLVCGFFALGAALLWRVPVEEGIREARLRES
jgi:UMF1 family MFS transporter